MSQKQPSLLERMRQGEKLTAAQQLELVVTLSIPAIMAQITSIVMQYIDASMVGSLGADASASIGLVSSSTWLFGGITGAVASGFSIQAAHKIGAGREDEARSIMRQSLLTGILISCALLVLGVMISGPLPGVLGGEMQIRLFPDFCVVSSGFADEPSGGKSASVQWRYENSRNVKCSDVYVGCFV